MPAASALLICGHPPGAAWGTAELAATFAMWLGMIAGMMGPIVLPWAMALSRGGPGPAAGRSPAARLAAIGLFLLGYLFAWSASGLAATLLQQLLAEQGILGSTLILDHPWAAGAALALVGLYQWTPLKDRCLKHCQSPATFFLTRWRDGPWGAVRMGARHGLYCIGCCWPLMALMLITGAMSLPWMIAVGAFVLAEMYVPALRGLSRLGGAVLIGLGALIPLLA